MSSIYLESFILQNVVESKMADCFLNPRWAVRPSQVVWGKAVRQCHSKSDTKHVTPARNMVINCSEIKQCIQKHLSSQLLHSAPLHRLMTTQVSANQNTASQSSDQLALALSGLPKDSGTSTLVQYLSPSAMKFLSRVCLPFHFSTVNAGLQRIWNLALASRGAHEHPLPPEAHKPIITCYKSSQQTFTHFYTLTLTFTLQNTTYSKLWQQRRLS